MMVEVSNFNFNFTKKFYGKLYYCCIKKYKHGAKEIVLDLRCCLALSLTQLDPRFNNDTQEMLNKPPSTAGCGLNPSSTSQYEHFLIPTTRQYVYKWIKSQWKK